MNVEWDEYLNACNSQNCVTSLHEPFNNFELIGFESWWCDDWNNLRFVISSVGYSDLSM